MAKVRLKRKTIRPPAMVTKKKRGRPVAPVGTTCDQTIMVRLSADLKERIVNHVQTLGAGWNISVWLRNVAEGALDA